MLNTTVSELCRSLKLDRIVIYKILPGGSGKIVTESVTSDYSSILGSEFPEETLPLFCQNKIRQQAYKAISDVRQEYQESFPCLVKFLEHLCVKSKIVVPIIYNTNLWGFLIAHQCSYYRKWTELEIELLCELSDRLAIAIKQSEVYHQLEVELQERKETQNKLQNSLREKEILLKEIHHRVKNNLNIISSMLNLQTDYIEDEQIINMFIDSKNRIRSIALIHEQLYNSTDLSRIDFAKYIQSLIENFCSVHNTDTRNINFEMNLIFLELNLETAIPCGLLINEIITNSYKHAFPDNSCGQIKINFSSDGVLHHLNISDNGIGIPENFDLENSTSLGLRLVNLLSMQLSAELQTHSSSKGTAIQLTFAELEYESRI
nr:histidine kinase dimerization/phosphoacceptor domain -containing protein [Myxosarcina sp. GI1]